MTYTIETRCPDCNRVTTLDVSEEGYRKRMNGALVQVAFPELSPEQREMLITGICPECWNKMFRMDEDNDE